MNKYLKSLAYIFGSILALTLILTLLNYIGLISGATLKILKIIIPLISFFIGGKIIGKNSTSKGWLSGIKISTISILIILLLSLLFKSKLTIYTFIYYIFLILLSSCGGIIGINKKL